MSISFQFPDTNLRIDVNMHTRKLPPSEGMANTVTVMFDTVTEEINENPTTGVQTLIESNSSSLPYIINFSISSTCRNHIRDLLLDRLMDQPWLCECLATRIASAASNLGFGINGFEIFLVLMIVTTERVSGVLSDSVRKRLICEGTIDEEELKKLKMESEPCSICLENLSGSKTSVSTRLPCSHVFHDCCLSEWLSRKNSCPMCRRILS